MPVAVPLAQKVKGVDIPIRDKLGRAKKRMFATKQDSCEVCGGPIAAKRLYRIRTMEGRHIVRENTAQIIRFCSKEHRLLRHRGLAKA